MKLIDTNELFFELKSTKQLTLIVEKSILDSQHYFSLSYKSNLMGIKPKTPLSKSIYIENEIAFKTASKLATLLNPNLVESRAYANNRKNACYIFISLNTEKHEINLKKDKSIGKKETLINAIIKNGFNPAIAISNGYDYNDKLVFYALLELVIDDKTFGYLTLNKYMLQDFILTSLGTSKFYHHKIWSALEEYPAPQFLKAYEDFLTRYNLLKEIKVTEEELVAITFDIYDKNRNIETIKSDLKLKKELIYFRRNAINYFAGLKADSLKYILNYIIRYQTIKPNSPKLSENQIVQALQEKKAYKNTNRLIRGKNTSSYELRKYIDAQTAVYRKLPLE